MPGFPPFRRIPGGPQPQKVTKPSAFESYGVLQATDNATVYINIENTGFECASTWLGTYLGEGEAFLSIFGDAFVEFSGDENLEWSGGDVVVTGINC